MALVPLSDDALDALAQRFPASFAHLDPRHARVALSLFRLLARGTPVPWDTLAGVTGREEAELRELLAGWPGVYEEARGITGFGGLSVRAVSAHRMVVRGIALFTRCAWDTLFLPHLLRVPAQVSSLCAATGTPVHLSVTPEGVSRTSPAGTVVSLLPPEPAMAADLTQHF